MDKRLSTQCKWNINCVESSFDIRYKKCPFYSVTARESCDGTVTEHSGFLCDKPAVLKTRRSGQRVLLYECGSVRRHTEAPGGRLAQFNIDWDIRNTNITDIRRHRQFDPLRHTNSLLHYRTAFRSNRRFRHEEDRTGIETRTDCTVYKITAVI